MKKTIIFSLVFVAFFIGNTTPQAHALSCLPIDMYFEGIVGDETVTIFTGTAIDQIFEENYTAEVIAVDSVKQGYVEGTIFVYHQKDETWGYLCNAGPGKENEKGFYVAYRDDQGTYNVSQRLSLSDPLIKALEDNLEDAEVVGEKVELTKTDRMNQILTTIEDLYEQIKTLFAEYKYWLAQK